MEGSVCHQAFKAPVFRKSFTADRFWSLDPGSATCVPSKLCTDIRVPSCTAFVPLFYTFPSPGLCFVAQSNMQAPY